MKTMLKHVVTWKMKEENKQENMKEIKSKLEFLELHKLKIPDIKPNSPGKPNTNTGLP